MGMVLRLNTDLWIVVWIVLSSYSYKNGRSILLHCTIAVLKALFLTDSLIMQVEVRYIVKKIVTTSSKSSK